MQQRMKEGNLLKNRVTLVEHVDTIIQADIQKLDLATLKAAIHAVAKCNVELPFDIRLQLCERQCADIVRSWLDEHVAANSGDNSERGEPDFPLGL